MKQEIERVIYYYFDWLTSSRNGKAVKAASKDRMIPGSNPSSDIEKKKIFCAALPGMHVSFFKPNSSPP
jgi:hypothetical protein